MPHHQGSSFLVGMRYYLKKGQPRVIQLRCRLMLLAFYQCFSLLDFVLTSDLQIREVAFVDDLTVAGKLADIYNLWDKLATIGPKYGYFPKSTKSYLIVKKICLKDAKTIFTGTNINITTDRRKHFRAVVGSDTYKLQYVEDLVVDWNTQLKVLLTIV